MSKKKFLFLSVFLFALSMAVSWSIKQSNAHAAINSSKTNGEYLLYIQKDGVWQKAGSLPFDKNFQEKEIDLR